MSRASGPLPPLPASSPVAGTDSAQVANRLGAYGGATNGSVVGLQAALSAVFDPGSGGDAVRQAMATADTSALKAALQKPVAGGPSTWDRIAPEDRTVLAGSRNCALAFKGFVCHRDTSTLIASVKSDPAGETGRKLGGLIKNLQPGTADQAWKEMRSAGKHKDPRRLGEDWAKLFGNVVDKLPPTGGFAPGNIPAV